MSNKQYTPKDVAGWAWGLGSEVRLCMRLNSIPRHDDELTCVVVGKGKCHASGEVLLFLSCLNLLLTGVVGDELWKVERSDLPEWKGCRAEVYES